MHNCLSLFIAKTNYAKFLTTDPIVKINFTELTIQGTANGEYFYPRS